jgi:hypothetical protein
MDAPRVQANLPTPWAGLWERVNIVAFLVWVVVLAVILFRTRAEPAKSDKFSPKLLYAKSAARDRAPQR